MTMLHVYHSNRLEALFILLCSLRESQPLSDPLTPEKILVANPGIGRWLNLQIADRSGIAANIEYVLPAEFVWQLYQNCLDNVPKKSAFERSALRLRVLNELDTLSTATDEHWAPLQRYIVSDGGTVGDTKRVQLASRIADVFDQYLVYRPKMILDWERGSNTIPDKTQTGNDPAQLWQPALWRRLAASINEPHRAALWQKFCKLADSGQIDPAQLPPQLHLFNVGLLPPSTLDVLVRLAKIGPDASTSAESNRVSLYFLNPAIDYWGDLLDMRRAARERLKLGGGTEPLADDQIGNPLLSSLGGSGRTLMKLLGDRSEWVHDEQFFLPADTDNLLCAVQADLLRPYGGNNTDEVTQQSTQPSEGDASIQLHQCYSPMREIQALHDRLLDRFNADQTLTPADVIVMVPDINLYAPVIEAVFGSMGGEPGSASRSRFIPWSIADRALVEVSQIVACVQRLFELPGFEFEATAVLGFAAEPAIARRFGFDDNGLKTITEWLHDTGVRRTLSGATAHSNSAPSKILHEPVAALHSWDFGLRRLLLGRAMPSGSAAVGNTLPDGHVEGQQAQLLSQLLNLLQALEECRVQLSKSHTPTEWVDVINDIINRLLEPADEESDALAQFRVMLVELEADAFSAGHTDAMTHATFAEILRGALAGVQRKNHRYLTGRVTFSSMVPLRSVPFRMVCMLGLNDSDFPRQRASLGFDLMAKVSQPGDRSIRDDDRYLFLEALLSAREELYLSWIYRNVSDNAPREPSVLISELRDYLDKRYPNRPARCIAHPLQPFSKALFQSDKPALHTFATEWEPPTESPVRAILNQITVDESGSAPILDEVIPLDSFLQFWRNPSDWYCRRILGIALWRDEQQPEDAEPFGMDGLSGYQLRGNLMESLLAEPDVDRQSVYTQQARSGILPHGGLGELTFDNSFEETRTLAERIREFGATPLSPLDIDITLNNQQLQGRLPAAVTWPDGSVGIMHYHAANLDGSRLTQWWLAYLIGSAAGKLNGQSLLVTRDKDRLAAMLDPQSAADKLQSWLQGWNQGQVSALPFFSKTSAAVAGAIKGSPHKAWLPPSTAHAGPGECEQESIQLLYSNIAQVPDREDVHQWANLLLGDEGLKP